MKRILLSLTFLYYLTLVPLLGQANGECLSGGCAFGGAQYPSTTQSTTSSSFVTIATNIYAGEWQRYEVISGRTYEWSLCASDGGNASYDSQLTLYNDTDNQLCYSDDYCSDDAKITWTATYTGFVKTRVNVYNCGTNSTNTTLVWRSLAPSATAVNCSGGGVTGTYCYGDNDNSSWGYTASDGARILTLSFNAGGIESCCDNVTIYDGSDNTGAVLYSGNNGGNLAGLTVTSTGPDIFMQMSSDGSVSCVSGSGCCTSQWDWDVFCASSTTTVTCGSITNDTYCYGDNDNSSWGYTASDGARTLTLSFNAGGIESCCDNVTIYDGSDNTGAVLYSGNNGGNLAGLTVTSIGPDIFMQMSSDGSVSCVSGSGCCTSQWDWDVFCASSTTTVTCGSITNDTYCYGDNDNSSWGYTASDNARTLTLTFNTGGIESCCDNITIYDGSDNTGIVLFSGANGGNLAGISVTSTGPNVFMEMSSDGSVSCASGSSCCTSQWDWEVECTTPSNNECINAELVNDGETVTGSTATATNVEALTPCQNGGGGQNCSGTGQGTTDFSAGVWFKYTSGSSETIIVSTDNASTNFDTEIIVYQGACGGLTCVGGDDDSGAGVNSIFCWESTANFAPVDYYIYVDGHSGSTGNYEFTINTMAILPVELASFEGETMKNHNLLMWETSSEANTETHQIERSINGRDNWKMIGEVAAAGNSSEYISYSLKDENPLPVAYYRLKSVDFGGYIEYSDILLLQRKTDKIEMISIAPNPTNDLVNIDFFTPDTDTYTITVTNMVGQLLIENQQDLEEGNQRQNIDLSNLDNGIYFLSISNGNESSVYKIIKQ